MTLRASGHSGRGSDALLGASREPAHVAVLAGGEEVGQPCARLGAKFGAAEADRIEAERQRAVADQSGRGGGCPHRDASGTQYRRAVSDPPDGGSEQQRRAAPPPLAGGGWGRGPMVTAGPAPRHQGAAVGESSLVDRHRRTHNSRRPAFGSASITGATALAIASSRASVSRGPTSVTPTGRLFGPRQTGMPTHGTCSSVHMRLKIALPVVCRPSGASPGALGVSTTSSDRTEHAVEHRPAGIGQRIGREQRLARNLRVLHLRPQVGRQQRIGVDVFRQERNAALAVTIVFCASCSRSNGAGSTSSSTIAPAVGSRFAAVSSACRAGRFDRIARPGCGTARRASPCTATGVVSSASRIRSADQDQVVDRAAVPADRVQRDRRHPHAFAAHAGSSSA